MLPIGAFERTLIVGSVTNGGLGAALGALIAGLAGAQVGLILGLLLAVVPVATRAVWAWVSRPGGLLRFVLAEIGAMAISMAVAVERLAGAAIAPVIRGLRGPTAAAREAAGGFAEALSALLGGLWRIVATPLGVANLAALGVVTANLASLDFATPVAFLALGMLLLVLLVSESEARDDEAARHTRSDP